MNQVVPFRKKYSQKDFDKNDPIARAAAKVLSKQILGLDAIDNPDKYGPDLLLPGGEFIEVERRESIQSPALFLLRTGDEMDDYRLSQRKWKMLEKTGFIIVFNKHIDCCMVFSTEDIRTHGQDKLVKNRFSSTELNKVVELKHCTSFYYFPEDDLWIQNTNDEI